MFKNTSKGFPRYYCENSKNSKNRHLCDGGSKSIAEKEIDQVLNEELHKILCDHETHLRQINDVLELVKERDFLNRNKKDSGLEDLYAQLQRRAEAQRRSLSAEVITLLDWAIEELEVAPATTLQSIRSRRTFDPAAAGAPDSTTLLRRDRAR